MPKGTGKNSNRGSDRFPGKYRLDYPDGPRSWKGGRYAPQGRGMDLGKFTRDTEPQALTVRGIRRSVQGTPEQAVNRTHKEDKDK